MSHINSNHEALEVEIREGLRSLIQNSTMKTETEIILPASVQRYWNSLRRAQFYTEQKWYDLTWDNSDIMKDYLIVMSILIDARIGCWEKFREIFIDKKRNDSGLPYPHDVLTSNDFLGLSNGKDFYAKQWMYCPLMIKEQAEPHKLTGMECERRFPFIGEEKNIGHGATGIVYKQAIAAGCLEYQPPRSSVNHKSKFVACKRVQHDQIETVEFENLQHLRGLLATHDRIMVNIATIIQDLPKAGTVHYILYDLAAYDLNEFLNQVPNSREKEHRRRSDTAPPGRNGSEHWNAADLIKESQHLADALDFLHHRLYNDKRVTMAHNDLKPENILIFYPDAPGGRRYPVGQWKIADFGLAKIKDQRREPENSKAGRIDERNRFQTLSPDRGTRSPEHIDVTHRRTRSTSVVSIRSMSITKSKRDPGRWSPPEVEGKDEGQLNPRSGDIWAFGCVLAAVLAFGVDPPLVAELTSECEIPDRLDQRFYDVETKKIKTSVSKWLSSLHTTHEHKLRSTGTQWVNDVATLILEKILLKETQDRLKAGSIRDQLEDIHKSMQNEMAKWRGQAETDFSEQLESPKHDTPRLNFPDAGAN
ncbi:kinase-like protein [Mytilinidion resinicola]|uniref:Kinase-like protein n=1 Tax=Mytilinidion resinicola TaxID=574789 RepID=A0A6A6YKU2_9PEZI|nr:kinase-like protein [Mytilinidion resinicola]KAF2809486.1 kinase-like protein [Mytilinidion resinicola]